MPIVNSIANLPRRPGGDGFPPSSRPFFVEGLAAAFDEWYEAQGLKRKDHAIPEAGPYRGSMASTRCDRAMYYKLRRAITPRPEPLDDDNAEVRELWLKAVAAWDEQLGVTNPPGFADYWTFWLGQLIHEGLQPVILNVFPGAAEAIHDLRTIGIPGSSHSDLELTIEHNGEPTLVEIKSTNGYSFKMQATTFQGPPQGPRYGAVLQAAMAAHERGINQFVVVLCSLEKVSPGMTVTKTDAGRVFAEWHYTVSEMLPQLEYEKRRILRLVDAAEHGELPAREIHDPEYPEGAVIQRPLESKAPWSLTLDGSVTDTGTTWMCGYCDDRNRCLADGAGE